MYISIRIFSYMDSAGPPACAPRWAAFRPALRSDCVRTDKKLCAGPLVRAFARSWRVFSLDLARPTTPGLDFRSICGRFSPVFSSVFSAVAAIDSSTVFSIKSPPYLRTNFERQSCRMSNVHRSIFRLIEDVQLRKNFQKHRQGARF